MTEGPEASGTTAGGRKCRRGGDPAGRRCVDQVPGERVPEHRTGRPGAGREVEDGDQSDARLEDVRTLFSPDEAEVLTRGSELVIRLIGLQFASGSTEIRPEHFSLLTKVRSVIREFPAAPVTIQGHTDSRGNDELNQSLSERRAVAVREYLLANTAMSADRLRAEGYGETQPIATNDTREGGSMNRRIDIVLDLSGR